MAHIHNFLLKFTWNQSNQNSEKLQGKIVFSAKVVQCIFHGLYNYYSVGNDLVQPYHSLEWTNFKHEFLPDRIYIYTYWV